jgi:hypothetical protein
MRTRSSSARPTRPAATGWSPRISRLAGGTATHARSARSALPADTDRKSGSFLLSDAPFTLRGSDQDQAGASVAGIGDMDGDGLADVIIAGPGDHDGAEYGGAAWIVPGNITR